MLRLLNIIVITATLAITTPILYAADITQPLTKNTESTKISNWINNNYPKSEYNPHIGIIIQSSTGDILYQQNEDQLFSPASIQKLFIAVAAITYLKPEFTYNTSILTNESSVIKNNTINGNVYVHFSGDPTLTTQDLNKLFATLKAKKITKITQSLYIDDSDFDQVPYPPGWLWGDLSYSFAAMLSAANLDQNKFLLHLSPNKSLGQQPSLVADIPNEIIKLSNNAITTKKYQKNCPLTVYSSASNSYSIGGCLAQPWKKQRRSLAIRDMHTYVKYQIEQILKQQKISVKSVSFKKAPATATLQLATIESKPLKDIVRHMLTDSDNLTANALLKTIGHNYYHEAGTWQNGIHAMQAILNQKTGINFKLTLLTDGAGLSRYNLATPQQFIKLLSYIDSSPEIKRNIINSLPKPGKPGTLINRLLKEKNNGRVSAKTGSMSGISSLAGYINTKHNGQIIFTIIANGFVGSHQRFNQFEDQLCTWLINTDQIISIKNKNI